VITQAVPSHEIVKLAEMMHGRFWQNTGKESDGDKLASLVTAKWQEAVLDNWPRQFICEYPVAKHLKERIDLVDTVGGIAYELKVSPNNTHFEFYKDIFKIVLARDNSLSHLNRFIFITPISGAKRMQKGLGKAVIEHSKSFGLTVEVFGI
jgi:hypothetical protein